MWTQQTPINKCVCTQNRGERVARKWNVEPEGEDQIDSIELASTGLELISWTDGRADGRADECGALTHSLSVVQSVSPYIFRCGLFQFEKGEKTTNANCFGYQSSVSMTRPYAAKPDQTIDTRPHQPIHFQFLFFSKWWRIAAEEAPVNRHLPMAVVRISSASIRAISTLTSDSMPVMGTTTWELSLPPLWSVTVDETLMKGSVMLVHSSTLAFTEVNTVNINSRLSSVGTESAGLAVEFIMPIGQHLIIRITQIDRKEDIRHWRRTASLFFRSELNITTKLKDSNSPQLMPIGRKMDTERCTTNHVYPVVDTTEATRGKGGGVFLRKMGYKSQRKKRPAVVPVARQVSAGPGSTQDSLHTHTHTPRIWLGWVLLCDAPFCTTTRIYPPTGTARSYHHRDNQRGINILKGTLFVNLVEIKIKRLSCLLIFDSLIMATSRTFLFVLFKFSRLVHRNLWSLMNANISTDYDI